MLNRLSQNEETAFIHPYDELGLEGIFTSDESWATFDDVDGEEEEDRSDY